MIKIRRDFTLVEFLIILASGLILILASGCNFPWIIFLWYVTAVVAVVGVLITIQHGKKGFLFWSVVLLVCMIGIVLTLPMMFPRSLARLSGQQYKNEKLSMILSSISQQKNTAPYWRFYIATQELADVRLNVDIPKGCRLDEALDIIATKADCEYEWHWHKHCGNEPIPHCAVFSFRPRGTTADQFAESAVLIDRHSILSLGESATE